MDQERFETSEIDDAGFVERTKGAIGDRVHAAKDAVSDNPMLMLLGGLAVGFLVGMLVPVSRFENENLGPVADDLKRRSGEVIKDSIEAATVSMTASSRQSTGDY